MSTLLQFYFSHSNKFHSFQNLKKTCLIREYSFFFKYFCSFIETPICFKEVINSKYPSKSQKWFCTRFWKKRNKSFNFYQRKSKIVCQMIQHLSLCILLFRCNDRFQSQIKHFLYHKSPFLRKVIAGTIFKCIFLILIIILYILLLSYNISNSSNSFSIIHFTF